MCFRKYLDSISHSLIYTGLNDTTLLTLPSYTIQILDILRFACLEPGLPLQRTYQVPALQEDWQDKNILLDPIFTSEICQEKTKSIVVCVEREGQA